MKILLNIVRTLLGLLYDAVAFVGRGVLSLLNKRLSSGVSRSATYVTNTYAPGKAGSTTSPLLWNPASASLTGMTSYTGFWYPQEDGRSFVLPATQIRQEENESSVSYQGHNVHLEETAKKFMDENKELFQNLAKLEEAEKLGKKYDNNKPALDLIPVEALNALGEALVYGARKYNRANWAKGIQQSRLIAAALRHITAYSSGQDLDPESGLSHISHALCNLAFLTYMQKNRQDMDDRWSKK